MEHPLRSGSLDQHSTSSHETGSGCQPTYGTHCNRSTATVDQNSANVDTYESKQLDRKCSTRKGKREHPNAEKNNL